MVSTSPVVPLTSLPATLSQAILFLTRPLLNRYSASTIQRLQTALGANLTPIYAPTWHTSEPMRGSGRRCLSFSPSCLPPRAIHTACKSAQVDWSDWIALLGSVEFDMFVDPGCISLRVAGRPPKFVTIWSEEMEKEAAIKRQVQEERAALLRKRQELLVEARRARQREQALLKIEAATRKKTFAQQILELDEDEDDELFLILNDEISAPTWKTPIAERFSMAPRSLAAPQCTRPAAPLKTSFVPSHTRSSSVESLSALSFASDESDESDGDSIFSGVSYSTDASSAPSSHASRVSYRSRVFVDSTKREVTPYDGGKTTVLTGGVMLGAPAPTHEANGKWRK